jgi:hypothetical protein
VAHGPALQQRAACGWQRSRGGSEWGGGGGGGRGTGGAAEKRRACAAWRECSLDDSPQPGAYPHGGGGNVSRLAPGAAARRPPAAAPVVLPTGAGRPARKRAAARTFCSNRARASRRTPTVAVR